jgi:NADPH2:quinone reductase
VQIALRLRAFGGPENFELTDVPKPAIRPGMALIRVDATSVNQIDVRIRSGHVPIGPDLPTILGADVAGTIEEVGAGVLDFAPGDEVYGCAGAPHGLPITHQQQLNADLLAFIKS